MIPQTQVPPLSNPGEAKEKKIINSQNYRAKAEPNQKETGAERQG
jgi:hypothetical protein